MICPVNHLAPIHLVRAPADLLRHDGHMGKRRRAQDELRDLAGAGRSQLGPEAAMRARDVNRPTEQDLAEAEQQVNIVRRHWRPSD